MKKLLLIVLSNILFAQTVPEPKTSNFSPPNTEIDSSKVDEELISALSPFIEAEKYGLGIIKYNVVSDYSSTGASFAIYNPSKKTIKYIWFSIAGENPVGDLVAITKGVFYKTLKGIGPVESNGIAEWSFDYVWLTDVVEYLKISTIKIQYMDGSMKTIKYNKNMYIGEAAYEYALIILNKSKSAEEKEETKVARDYVSDVTTVYSEVDQSPEFPGGIGAFRNKVSGSFNASSMKGDEGTVKTEVTFVVERDGSITDVKTDGKNLDFNSETIRTIKSIKNKWTPAKINGKSVRYRFRLPLTMNFEDKD